ncbi:lasso peptide isopeptide bond-forming cyclase [Mesobacillus foraminis]|uniref:asparagine synthase (glutamine-hydrolyzing) n=1 Tax=Mesobacillus foraminis TaxID=279826 RepID=A0A4R2B7A0_9BACI|nr:lasso peptide isopeptide bond-forming cyclase [Mesobacillus foraminis]TCN22175.1 asparagine synthase (glutamine-hydrolysing) [Mesobacillus foraminis]
MSAIAGIINFNKEPINRDYSLNMMKALEKFPADDIRVFQKDNVFLGCHAQWITPESIGEPLPFYDTERQCAITADAIIDNRDELFEKLQVDRTKRKTMPDSQLILLAYYKWGEESPKHLVGDFAYMIWDERKQKLFGARDISGYRTLYYYNDSNANRFAFCTTINSVLTIPYVEKKLNELWLAEYLAITGTIDSVDAVMTPFKGINQIPPAHTVSITINEIKLHRYTSFFTGERLNLKSDNEYVEAFQDVFKKAITARLRTHRKIGSQLSGGLDSGAVVGFAAKALSEMNKSLHTFSYIPASDFIDFTPKRLFPDERPYIKETVKFVGGISDHYFNFDGKDSYSDIEDYLEIMEMPYKFFENSFWLKGMFEKAHEKGIGVLLNGDRGNFTISWGNALNYYSKLLKRLKWLRLFDEINKYSKNVGGPRLRRLPEIAKLGFPVINKLLQSNTNDINPILINPDFAERTGVLNKLKDYGLDQTGWLSSPNLDEQRRVLLEDIFPWNAGNTLTSKLSLRYSLWKRDPTNDIRVVRFCLSLPDEQYVQNGLDRALIRRSTESYLPNFVRLNQRTRGVQGADWVHRIIPFWDNFKEESRALINDKRILELMDGQVLRSAYLKIEDGPKPENDTDNDYRILMRSLIVYRFIKKFA